MMPVVQKAGISNGYLKPAEGIIAIGDGPGIDRGAINWRGDCYRVMGTKLCRITPTFAILGDVGHGGQCTLDYSFELLAVASGGRLYYWDGAILTQNTDTDLGYVIDMLWIDGYFMVTDGATIAVTELNDPYSVNPLKYGSSEADPDPINGLLKYRNEVFALNSKTIELFDNAPTGTGLFPFQRIESAQIMRGSIGTFASAVFLEQIAFLGSGRNEAPAVWLGTNSQTSKISTREVDLVLATYTEAQLALVIMEVRVQDDMQLLYMHLPDKTLVYDGAASVKVQEAIWFILTSSVVGDAQYLARNFVWAADSWLCGDPVSYAYGRLTQEVSTHYGDVIGWDFSTQILWNDTKGAIFHQMELSGLPGRVPLGDNPVIWTSYSTDGQTFSQERPISAGKQGDRNKRLVWLQQGSMNNVRIQKFRGTSDAHMPFARLDAVVEPLYV